MSKNLVKYAALHRMVNEMNLEIDEAESGQSLSEDRQVIASVGGAVMALGMGLAELATADTLPEAEVAKLLHLANDLSIQTAIGFDTLVSVDTGNGVSAAADLAKEVAELDILTMGLREVPSYVAARPKPIPLEATVKIQNSSISGTTMSQEAASE